MPSSFKATSSWKHITSLTIFVWIIFWRVSSFDFVNLDDDIFVYNNIHIAQGISLQSLQWAFTATLFEDTIHQDYWLPLTILSRILDIHFFGLNPHGHHLSNLLLHTANCILLYFFILRLWKNKNAALFIGAIFACHPLQIEAVAWISARKDLLGVLCGLLTLHMYTQYVHSRQKKYYLITLLSYILSLMSKPITIILPAILILMDLFIFNVEHSLKTIKNSILSKLAFFMISGISIALTFRALSLMPEGYSLQPTFSTYIQNLFFYLNKAVFPWNLTQYGPVLLEPQPVSQTIFQGLTLIAITTSAILCYKKNRTITFAILWIGVSLAPVLSLNWPADRHFYFASIGWGILLFALLSSCITVSKLRLLLAIGMVSTYALISSFQLNVWKNSTNLYQHTLNINPKNYLAHNNLGTVALEADRPEEAMRHFKKALEIKPDYTEANTNLATVYFKKEQFQEAKKIYDRVLTSNPNSISTLFNYAIFYDVQKQWKQAAAIYERLLKIDPKHFNAHRNVAMVYEDLNKIDLAIEHYEAALQISPNDVTCNHNLGVMYGKTNKLDQAFEQYQKTIQLAPHFADAWNNLGVIHVQRHNFPEAQKCFQEALTQSPQHPNALRNLQSLTTYQSTLSS